jgi:hypothetical protein
MEILVSFMFITSFLLIKYKPSLKNSDEVMKGLGISFIMAACYGLSA